MAKSLDLASFDPETPLSEAMRLLAEAGPRLPAVTFVDRDGNERSVSRGELDARTTRLARVFAERGVERGAMVTIALPNSIAVYESTIASWKVGAIPQPVSHRLPLAELEALVEIADPALVIGLDPGDGRPVLPSGFEPDPSLSDDPLTPVVAPAWKAPTSGGSTGRPKIIVSGHAATLTPLLLSSARVGIEPGGVVLCTGPLAHNAPYLYSLAALMLGAHVVLMERFDAERALELVERHRVTWMYAVPTMMSRILKLPDGERRARDLSSLETVFHLAAPCPPHVKRAWIEWLGPERIREIYAGTEAQAATYISGREWLEHPGSVGKVVLGEMRIFDEFGDELPPGEVGTVWMRPPEGMQTYHYRGAEARRRDDGWETLGDMGHFDEDGYLYLTGRDSDMILVGGANVYPAEVEAALASHPKVVASCVIGLPDEDYGSVVHAIVEVAGEATEGELRAHLEQRLTPYKLPRSYELTTESIRDEADKVRRAALREARTP